MALPTFVARAVRTRASFCCEYCLLPAQASVIPFEIDHIIARKHGGPSDLDNLALSCFYCNSAKVPNIAGVDSETGLIVPLYHPRQHLWQEHFIIEGTRIVAKTSAGRATIAVLEMNAEDMMLLRGSLIDEGSYPPRFDNRANP